MPGPGHRGTFGGSPRGVRRRGGSSRDRCRRRGARTISISPWTPASPAAASLCTEPNESAPGGFRRFFPISRGWWSRHVSIRRHAATCSTDWASSIIWQGSSMRRSTNSHWHGEALSTTVTRTSSSTWKSVRLPWPRVGWRMRKRTSNEHTGRFGRTNLGMRCHCWPPKSPAARACAGVQPARTGRCTGQSAETAAGNPDFVLGLCRSEWCGRRPEAPERGRRQCAGGGRRDAGPCPRCRIAGTRSVSVGATGIPARNRRASRGCRTGLASA